MNRVIQISLNMLVVTLLVSAPASGQDNGVLVLWGDTGGASCHLPANNTGFVAVGAGDSSTSGCRGVGLKADGTIVALGAVGPVPGTNADFVAIAAGEFHWLGLKADGSIVAWGSNSAGQCDVPAPNTGYVEIAAGCGHSLALKADGSIVAWGWNGEGECDVPAPNTGFVGIAGGCRHSLGVKADGSIVAWGINDWYQCDVPAPNAGFRAVAGGRNHSMALKTDGSIVTLGFMPPPPSPNTGFLAIESGLDHCLGLKASGSIVAWGRNTEGECDVPTPNTGYTAIAGGERHNYAVRGYACGDLNFDGSLNLDDYPLFLTAFGHCRGNAAYRLAADCDQDGCTTLADYRIWRQRYSEVNPSAGPVPFAGDLDCSGRVDLGDINPFVLALTDQAAYAQAFPDCTTTNGDINSDGNVDFGDINPFVALLAGG